jgi:tetratricopeptide (TPR) repeat protein
MRWIGWLLASAASVTAFAEPTPEALIEAGHWKQLRALVEPMLKTNPNDARAAYLMSRARLAFADPDGALALAEKAVAAEPANSQYRLQLARVLGAQAQRSGMFKAMGLAKRFRKEAEQAAALDPKNIEARLALVDFHLQAPGIAGGDKKKADALAQEVFELDASRGWLARATILSHSKTKDLRQLEAFCVKAVQAGPASYVAQLALASYYASDDVRKYELSESHAREARRLDPQRAGALVLIAQALAKQQRLSDLDAHLAEAEASVPDNLTPYYTAGRTLVIDGKDPQRAERYLDKYLSQEPEELRTAVKLDPEFEPARKDFKRLK